MKKNRNRRLRLHRETLRSLTAVEMTGVAGGRTGSTCENSCDFFRAPTRPISACESCLNTCDTCVPDLCNWTSVC